jgi:hypothetical protein
MNQRVKTKSKQALCPQCHSLSAHLHSRYVRRLADLPWFGVAVRVEAHARRLYCRHKGLAILQVTLPTFWNALGRPFHSELFHQITSPSSNPGLPCSTASSSLPFCTRRPALRPHKTCCKLLVSKLGPFRNGIHWIVTLPTRR